MYKNFIHNSHFFTLGSVIKLGEISTFGKNNTPNVST
jgi:hypothetical protein